MYFWTEVGTEKSGNYTQGASINHAGAVPSRGGAILHGIFINYINELMALTRR